jgi:CheY-like chemotaxis protein
MDFDVVECACGDEAIVLFREQGPFDLVLTDLYYFDEITEPPLTESNCIRDGIQFSREVRTIRSDQHIAIHTGSQQQLVGEVVAIPILEKGTDEFLPKLAALLKSL